MKCPTEAELLLLALAADPVDADVAHHAAGCERCRRELSRLQLMTTGIRASDAGTRTDPDECLDELALASLLEDTDGPGQRSRSIAHLAACGHCRRRVSSLRALLADPGIAAELRGTPVTAAARRRRFLAGAALVASAALVLLVLSPARCELLPVPCRASDRLPDTHRDGTITAGSVPMPLAPVGDVATPVRALTWNAVPGADRYRAVLFDASGRTLLDVEATDTVVPLPDSVVTSPGKLYLWKVEARTAWGRWVSSELTEFRPGLRPTSMSPTGRGMTIAPAQFAPRVDGPVPDSLRLPARSLPDSALAAAARSRPADIRDALNQSLARVAGSAAPAADAELAYAARLADAYAAAWNDQFLNHEVQRFAVSRPMRRAAKVRADSTRRAGTVAFSRDGTRAAIVIWRRALSMASAIADTAGIAATLGNIGAALAQEDQADSAALYLERARRLAASIGDTRVEANATAELAGLEADRRNIAGARESYARAIALRNRIGDSRGLAADYNNLAGLALDAGDPAEARRQLEAALTINRQDGRPEVAATNLVNLAELSSAAGDFAVAEAQFREALTVWRRREQWADAADALRGLADMEVRRGDYPAARADLREALVILERTGPMASALAVRLQLSRVRAGTGDLQGALDDLRAAQRRADSAIATPDLQASLALARADLSAQLNLRAEAARLYGVAEQFFRRAGDRAGEAEALQGEGMLLLDQGDPRRARELLAAALAGAQAAGNARGAAITRIWLSRAALLGNDTTGARRQLITATRDLERLGDPVAAAVAEGQFASVELAARRPAAAESLYRAALRRTAGRVAPDVTWSLHAGLAATLRSQGADDAASVQWRTAIAETQAAGNALALPERRSAYLTDKWDSYAELALLERDRGRVAAAFDVSEQLRAGEMLALLSQGRIDATRGAPTALVAREQDLRRRIGELTTQLEPGAVTVASYRRGPSQVPGPVNREALLQAQASYAELLLEIRERAPRHAALVSRETTQWDGVASRLAPDEVFVEYLVSDAATLAFVISRDTLVALALGAGRRDLQQAVDFVRGTIEPRGSLGLDSLWRSPLRQLHRDLIAPIEAAGLLAGKSRMIIVPHAELHYLPFAALIDGERNQYLVERFQVEVTPSASIWLALGARRRPRAVAGVLALAPVPATLGATQGEVESIARTAGPGTLVLSGTAATEAAFRREAPRRRVLHLATLGALNKQNPLFSFVELAPQGADDGRLEVHEVFGLEIAADLVVLSACQTGLASGGLADVPAGDDWIGLSRAFLSAGAGAVVATLWTVQDRATAELMREFYRDYLNGGDVGHSLAAAQRRLLKAPATASPYYWAGFEFIGGR